MSVAERISKRREELGFSQTDLAKRAGLKPPAISQYESGARSPSYEALIKLSNALNVTTDYLISGKEFELDTDKKTRAILKIIKHLSIEKKDKLLEYAIFLNNDYFESNIPILNESDYADYVLKNYSKHILPIDVREIANRLKIMIYEEDLEEDGEGILIKGQRKVIILDNKVKNEQRKKFTLGILIGHAIIPWHVKSTYIVRKSGTSTLLTDDFQEMEAQDFAASLIMPQTHLVKDFVKTRANIENLKKLALEKYDVSLFALINRLVEYSKDKYSVVQSEDWKIIKTFQGNRPLVEDINSNTLTASFFINPSEAEEIRNGEIPAKYWFIDADDNEMIHEECIFNPELKKVLTLLSIEHIKKNDQ